MPSRYTDQKLLRNSHFGDVYQATDSETGDEVILRRLFDAETAAAEPESVSTLERRTARLTGVRHPNVAAVLDSGADNYGGYIASEWIKGNDLTTIVSQAALTPEDFATVARHTLDGLTAIHEHKLIHGSLRPSRIIVHWDEDQNLRFVITDLGLAELLDKADIVTTDDLGNYNGAVDCMAPELFEGQPGSDKTDLYSLGNIFYYALTQSLPFAADTADATLDRHHAGDVVHLADVRQDLSAPFANWVMSLIARNAEDRPLTAAVARQSLDRAILGEEPEETGIPPELATGAAATNSDLQVEAEPEIPASEEIEGSADGEALAEADIILEEPEPAAEAEPEPVAEAAIGDEVAVIESAAAAPEAAATPATAKVTVSAVPTIADSDVNDTESARTPARKRGRSGGGWIPPTVGGVIAVGLGALVWFKFLAPSDENSNANTGTTSSTTATPAPLPGATPSDSSSSKPATAPAATSGLPITDGLLARFGFDEIAPAPNTTVVSEWPKQEGMSGIGPLRAEGVDSTTGSQVRKIVATPTMFPALNGAHSLLQITGKAALRVQWQRDNDAFLTGDQLTCTIIFWTPEKDADLFRMHPPIASEAEISARIIDKQLISYMKFDDREFPIIPFPHGNQLIALTLTWTGPQDSVMQSVMTASGARYNSKLAPAPNLSLLISSLTVGGDAEPLTETRPSGIYIAELLLYDRALSERERVLLDSYLNKKYFR
jgi:hypothetical protein